MKDKASIIRYITIICFFIVAGVIIFHFYPNVSKFQYSYEKGSPWQYEMLTAPFAFEIQKSEKEVQNEKDNLLSGFLPYYNLNESLLEECLKTVNNRFGKDNDIVTGMYKQYIIKKLKEVYNAGIMTPEDIDNLKQNNNTEIFILTGNFAKEKDAKKILTTKSAYEKIIQEAPTFLDKNTLRDYNVNNYIKENLTFNKEKTENSRKELLKTISLTKGRIQSGEKIIDHGEIITNKTFDILNSLKYVVQENSEKKNSNLIMLGQALIISSILCAFFLYLILFRKKFIYELKNTAFMLSMIVILCSLTSWVVKQEFSPYIIPYAILPIIITTFFDTRTALFTHLTTILLSSFVVNDEFEFLFIQITVGMISICTLKNIFLRSQLVKAAALIVLTYCILYLGNILVHEKGFEQMEWKPFLFFVINGVLLLFANPFIYIIEKLFGYMSDVSLVELANTNNALLRKFSEIAPGSFQHSMQVSNLASEAALCIGANPMLARTGALYHDIGKMNNPVFFTENQSSINPHTELNDEEKSAQIIIKHVTDGIIIAKKYGLPEKIQDFIKTHHGMSKTKYFYYTMKNKYPDKEIDVSKFTYPGPLPTSKEMAILVMCDAVEAASRSLKEYTDKSINDLVEKIISDQIQEGIFEETPITFKQINNIKAVLKDKLKTIYHTRISYPELNKNENQSDNEETLT